MISYIPKIYPDELVYSWFCRYYTHSGHLTNKSAMTELLFNRHNNLSKEFIGHLNSEALKTIEGIYPLKELILKHTMFPQYARFIPLKSMKDALYRLAYDFCDVHHLFSILPRSETDVYLKYCSMCVKEDREKYGEAYWHRIHQIRNMKICPTHNCELINSTVTAKSEHTFVFCPAEEYVTEQLSKTETSSLLIDYCKYISNVFNSVFDLKKDIPISTVLYNAMVKAKYVTSKGKTRHTKRLADDLRAFYERIGISDIASFYQIQRVLLGDSFDFTVICQIAFFLKISIKDLTAPLISEEQLEWERNTHYMKGKTNIDWLVLDEKTVPILEKIASDIYNGKANKNGRPERVSERCVYRALELPAHSLINLPKCREILNKYSETYEENWARKIIWAYKKLKKENYKFYWSDIRTLSGVKKSNLQKVIPFIKEKADRKTGTEIVAFLSENIYFYDY